MRARGLAAVLVLAWALPAQAPKKLAEQMMESTDPVKREIAYRALCQLDVKLLPTETLVGYIPSPRPHVHRDVVAVLMHHGVAKDELRKLLPTKGKPYMQESALRVLPLARVPPTSTNPVQAGGGALMVSISPMAITPGASVTFSRRPDLAFTVTSASVSIAAMRASFTLTRPA